MTTVPTPPTPPDLPEPAIPPTPATPVASLDPLQLVRTRSYVVLLVFGAVIGVPVAAIAYFFLKVIAEAQQWVFTTLPKQVGFAGEPAWWPILPLTLSGLLVALCILYLPGSGGHEPAEGFKPAGGVQPIELPGIILAAFATLALGAVLGPEAPLVAIGGGLGVLILHLVRKDAPAQATLVIGAAGSFAAVSTLLGSPILGAFLLMEAAGLGGPLLSVILLPGLLAAGVGTLIFVGLGSWTGYGTFSLVVPHIPPFTSPDGAEFLWAIGIGVAGAVVGTGIRRLARLIRTVVVRHRVIITPVVGLAVGGLAIAFFEGSGRPSSEVLFSGQSALPALIEHAGSWTVGALALLLVCKGLAYAGCLGGFRGGPTFPGMFLGAAGGILLSHLPGLPTIAGVAMGIGAMTVVMLNGLPLTAILLTSVFLEADGLSLVPLIIVATVVSFVVSTWLAAPPATPPSAPEPSSAPTPTSSSEPPPQPAPAAAPT